MTILIFMILSSSCLKSIGPDLENGLPRATTEGRGIFGCRVNGQPWIADRGSDTEGLRRNDSLVIQGTKSTQMQIETLGFRLYNIFDTIQNQFALTDTTAAFSTYSKTGASDCFITGPGFGDIISINLPNGVVNFTRLTGGIVSGTFSYYVPRDYCDTLFITDGRFDFKYRTLE